MSGSFAPVRGWIALWEQLSPNESAEHPGENSTDFQNLQACHVEVATVTMKEVFLSYHHKDKKIAAKVKTELKKAGFSSFLAHDDIRVSRVWREEILKRLDSCSALMAIVTKNFASSVWVNQEVGAAMARGKPIVSLRILAAILSMVAAGRLYFYTATLTAIRSPSVPPPAATI
jgi:hypothetical protein